MDTKNVTRYWVDRYLLGLSLLRADFTTHEYAPHTHEAFVIAVTEVGGAEIQSRGRVEPATPSTFFVSNPAEPQAAWMGRSRRWRYRAFYLTRSVISEIARGLGLEAAPYFTRNMFSDADLTHDFFSLHRTLEEGGDPFRARELLVGTVGELWRRHGRGGARIEPPPRDRAVLNAVIDLMRARHAERLRLEEISSAVALTPFQLIGLFKRTVGLTPHACLTQVRLHAACRHLRRGIPIAEAAAASGFYDQSALTRHFKRSYGITPLQFVNAAGPVLTTRR